ncbi:MAG: GGDEF domain-containing protein [Methylococcaceae bacterium]
MSFIAKELAQTELFKDVPDAILDVVRAHASPLELMPGEVLLSPERENHHIYLLLSGTLSLHFGSLDSPEVRVLEKGISVGEMSIIDHAMPSAFVIAREAARVFPVHRDLLLYLVADANPVACNLLRLLTLWIKANTECIVRDRSRIGVLINHANTDALTGLYNRRWLDNALAHLLTEAIGAEEPLCILLVDVDHFKKYNDRLGHLAGDQALITIGNSLKTLIRPYDFATRYGGEEFLILLPNTTKNEGVAVAERIRLSIEKKAITRDGVRLPGITVSIGLVINTPDSTPKSLIDAADAKLYQAKQQGRNCIKC